MNPGEEEEEEAEQLGVLEEELEEEVRNST